MLKIIKDLESKCKVDFFDDAVDPGVAPGYYQEGSMEITAWGTEVMHFRKMNAKQHDYDANPKVRLGRVEHDLNLMIYNALIYNGPHHPVNKEALKLYKAGGKVIKKWLEKGEGPCRECGGDEV